MGAKPFSSLPIAAGKTVEVLLLVVMDPLCFYVEIYKTDNPQMKMSTFQLFIPRGLMVRSVSLEVIIAST